MKDVSFKSTQPWVRSGTILAIVDFLKKSGHEPESIVGERAKKIAEAADFYRQVDLLNVMAIFQKVAHVTKRPDIGLEMGLSVDLKLTGPFGFLYMNAPTIGAALSDYVKYGPVWQSHAHFGLSQEADQFCLEYTSNHPEMPGWELDNEVTVAYNISIINRIAGKRVTPTEIHFEHAPICRQSDYRRLLSVSPLFNQNLNRIYYPHSLLEEKVVGANPLLYNIFCRHMSDLAHAIPRENNLVDIVRNNIRRGLGTNAITLEHISSELGMEPRTLQRHLGTYGTSFQEISDQTRLDLAQYYLERTSMDLTSISMELGYANVSTFGHAFKRWTGQTPGEYRKNLRQNQP